MKLYDKLKWAYEFEDGVRVCIGDRVVDFFPWLNRELYGVVRVVWGSSNVVSFCLCRSFIFPCLCTLFLKFQERLSSSSIPEGECLIM